MKKLVSIVVVVVFVWGCSKKMAPAGSTSSSNTGSTISNTPSSFPSDSKNSNTAAVSTTTTGVAGETGTRSSTSGAMTAEQMGQQTFNAKCGSCHQLKVTTDYTAERWISIMQVMAMKANLSETEKANVVAYVTANAKR